MGAVATYDLSSQAGWALYSPGFDKPRFGVKNMPKAKTCGSHGPAFHLLFRHMAWLDRNYGLEAVGYEAPMIATGGKKDDKKTFVTNPKTQKMLTGLGCIVEMSADMLGIPVYRINNASWRSFWLPGTKRGTDRATWKALSVNRAFRLGWVTEGDDDADALGQLHWLLNKLGIEPPWMNAVNLDLVRGGTGR